MQEKDLQDFIENLIARGQLLDSIVGWDEVLDIALDRLQGRERLLLLDNLVLHRAAGAALLIRDRLIDLTPVSNNKSSISLDRSEGLFADLLYVSPLTGTVVVFEIKRARPTARETVTELLAYEQELRNHLPFAARTDICFVVVSTDYAPLLDHSLSSLTAWHGLKILCLKIDETQQLTVRLPKGWTSLGQDVIPSQHIGTTSLTFVPHDRQGDPVQVGVLPRRRDARAGLVVHLANSFGLACEPEMDSDELTVMIREIPAELLLDEYTRAVPAALDIAVPTLHFDSSTELPRLATGAVAVLRRLVCEHRKAGRHPGLYIDASGEYRIVMLEDETVAMLPNPTDDEVIVRTLYLGGESHELTTWAGLAGTEPTR